MIPGASLRVLSNTLIRDGFTQLYMVADAKPTVSVIIRMGMRYLFDMALKYEKYALLLIRG
jgi:hypothetical protein